MRMHGKSQGLKNTEIGLIPEEWQIIPLNEVATIETGKRMKGGGKDSGEVLSLGGEHINPNGSLDLAKPKYISKRFYDELRSGKVQLHDVLMVKDGATTGKLAYVKSMPSRYLATNEHLFVLRGRSEVLENYFLYAALLSKCGQFQVNKAYHGLIGGITRRDTESIILPLPPLSEQKTIAATLYAVQEAAEKTQAVIDATRALKKSMMKYLFTYGPVPFTDAENVQLNETYCGLIPEHWAISPLQNLCRHVVDCPHSTPQFLDHGVLVVRNFNIRDGELCLNRAFYTNEEEYLERIRRCPPEEGDVLFSREAPIGEACQVPRKTRLSLGQRTMLIRPDPALLNSHYLVQAFYSERVRKSMLSMSSGVTVKHLNVADVRKMLIPVPPLDEQRRISDDILSIEKKINAEGTELSAINTLFETFLENLMTGKLRLKNLEVPT